MTAKMDDAQIDALRVLAENAKPPAAIGGDEWFTMWTLENRWGMDGHAAAYIVVASPTLMLALLDMVSSLKGERDGLQSVSDLQAERYSDLADRLQAVYEREARCEAERDRLAADLEILRAERRECRERAQ